MISPGIRKSAVLLLIACAAVTLYIVDYVVESNFAKTHPEKHIQLVIRNSRFQKVSYWFTRLRTRLSGFRPCFLT